MSALKLAVAQQADDDLRLDYLKPRAHVAALSQMRAAQLLQGVMSDLSGLGLVPTGFAHLDGSPVVRVEAPDSALDEMLSRSSRSGIETGPDGTWCWIDAQGVRVEWFIVRAAA
jgi:hypothetical protein